MNQLATPGLGSLLAGRKAAGIGQLLVAVAGFLMVMVWFAVQMYQFYSMLDASSKPQSVGWIGAAGGVTFAVSWIWSLFTSISLLREAGANQPSSLPPIPPLIH